MKKIKIVLKLVPQKNKKNVEKKEMCKKLKEVSGLSATAILEKYGKDSGTYAVDIRGIMKEIGIYVISHDFSELNDKLKCNILGAIVLNDEDLGVFVSSKCSEEEQRFILAHELGHCCLHSHTLKSNKIECASDFDSNDPHEHDADVFADKLLLPEKTFAEVCEKFIKKDIYAIAEIFGVTSDCVRRRMSALGIT